MKKTVADYVYYDNKVYLSANAIVEFLGNARVKPWIVKNILEVGEEAMKRGTSQVKREDEDYCSRCGNPI